MRISMSHTGEVSSLESLAQKVIRENHPRTVGQLAQGMKKLAIVDDDDLVIIIKRMAHEGSIKLARPDYSHETLIDYFLTPTLSDWFWVSCLITVLTVLFLRFAPNLSSLVILRWALGSIFVLYLPGYALMRFLLPNRSEMDATEKYTLNVVASFTVTALLGVFLEFAEVGLTLLSVTTSVAVFALFFITVAAIRDHQQLRTRLI